MCFPPESPSPSWRAPGVSPGPAINIPNAFPLLMQSPSSRKQSPFVGCMSFDWPAAGPESQRLEDTNLQAKSNGLAGELNSYQSFFPGNVAKGSVRSLAISPHPRPAKQPLGVRISNHCFTSLEASGTETHVYLLRSVERASENMLPSIQAGQNTEILLQGNWPGTESAVTTLCL